MLRGARSSLNVVKHHALYAPALSRLLSIAPASGQASPAAATDLPPQATSNASSSRHVPAKRHSRPRYNTTSTDADGEQPKRLLQPHVLSQRLTRMCTDGRLDEALEYLKTLPLDSQNTAVWNTLISQAGSQRRTKLAYQIYIEMKRRGFKPNLITFATLMGAFAKIPSWEKHTKLYESVHKTYQAFLDFIDAVKEHNPQSPQIAVAPVDAYIRVLARAADYQRAFDVWNALDEDGPLSPGIRTYSAMLFVCCLRGQTASGETAQSVRERAASDARLIWRQLVKRMERDESLVPDVILIDIMIRCLALGRPADHIVAFDILRDYVGLAKPGETAPPAQVELSPILLQDVLFLCQMAQKPRLCVHFVQQLMETQPTILDNGHMEQVLTAYGTLGAMGAITDASRALQTVEWMIEREVVHGEGTRIRPGLATFTLVLNACWRAKDWDSTVRTFELMTGLRGEDFTDEGAAAAAAETDGEAPRARKRSLVPNVAPDAAAMSGLIHTALESGNQANMRQCLRIVKRIGLSQLLAPAARARGTGAEEGAEVQRSGARFHKDHAFYAHKAARGVVELVDALVPKKTEGSKPRGAEERGWVELRSTAKGFLVAQRENRPRSTPELEEHPLGSAEGLAAMDSAVEWDRIHREQKSAR